ncbi:cell wall hydrolase [Oscillibacter sp.]|uniref:cell wall hydrolase n=1 Tax=Oscillibacter sp. TaxID=1945593 RepID=UPI0026090807|nr:cell wall hydrolase [Oscillibacter sp.]MDD3347159.1 cell wall hydrolase [Oscillibacter sp.]
MCPLRTLLDTLGGWKVRWDSGTGTAVAEGGSRRLRADPGTNTVTLDGMTYPATVYVESGRTFVPLRLVSNLLGGAAVTSADASYDAVELYWLSRIISAESRGEPLEGQIAVGNVVLNRVDSTDFPASIPSVVFDKTDAVQFEPVANGTVYDLPTDQSVEAAMRALDGESTVGDALYFYAPALSGGVWINESRTYFTTIGCHRFYL